MLRCDDCRRKFERPDTVEEYRGEFWGAPAYESVSVCPYCGSSDIWDVEDEDEEEEE